eukprot:TRINITY_DN20704_c0_g1_i1.p1 TRINITY_DN20704_c0_g1~~TRINITY_DN20704_c0_g1_i1.p1  ORF type:complete len:295 (-),score=36.01 TRINITY_DN20704_c0_g1_i1:937-1821(-)
MRWPDRWNVLKNAAAKMEPAELLSSTVYLMDTAPKQMSREQRDRETYETRCTLYNELRRKGEKDLRLPLLPIATAAVYLHRFFAVYSVQAFDPRVVGVACLLLACKCESTARRLKELIPVFFDHEGESVRQRVCEVEMLLVEVLGFDFAVEHPYKTHFRIHRELESASPSSPQSPRPRPKGFPEWERFGFNLITDSYNTSVCVKTPPDVVAAAVVHLAAECLDPQLLPQGDLWRAKVPVNPDELVKIKKSLLNYYYFAKNQEYIGYLSGQLKFGNCQPDDPPVKRLRSASPQDS